MFPFYLCLLLFHAIICLVAVAWLFVKQDQNQNPLVNKISFRKIKSSKDQKYLKNPSLFLLVKFLFLHKFYTPILYSFVNAVNA